MNLFSAFTSEVFRPLATILIPGAIGISTWVIALLWQFTGLKELASQARTESGFVVFLAMVFGGLIFEDLGSHLEGWLDGRADKKTQGVHSNHWYEYLRTCFKADPIGRRYLRTLVLRLKFELGVAFAMISAGFGVLWLASLGLSCKAVVVSMSVCVGFCAWGLIEAKLTHDILAKGRAELLKDIRIVGAE